MTKPSGVLGLTRSCLEVHRLIDSEQPYENTQPDMVRGVHLEENPEKFPSQLLITDFRAPQTAGLVGFFYTCLCLAISCAKSASHSPQTTASGFCVASCFLPGNVKINGDGGFKRGAWKTENQLGEIEFPQSKRFVLSGRLVSPESTSSPWMNKVSPTWQCGQSIITWALV